MGGERTKRDKSIVVTDKRVLGRLVEKPMPAPIPDTPENVPRALASAPPKDGGD